MARELVIEPLKEALGFGKSNFLERFSKFGPDTVSDAKRQRLALDTDYGRLA